MSEEIKKTEQTELSQQELDKVAGGRKKGYAVGSGGDAISIAPKTPALPKPPIKAS